MVKRIEDYAVIGDCETAALVGRNGSIDWLCWPRFNSGAVFAALLGGEDNGYWRIAATSPGAHVARRYRENTLILETDIETEDGAATPDRLHATEAARNQPSHSHGARSFTAVLRCARNWRSGSTTAPSSPG